MNPIRFIFFLTILPIYCLVNASSWLDPGNYNISWFNVHESEFSIKTAKDFAGIAFLVNNGYSDFSGKTITLEDNINLWDHDWIPIGATTTSKFKGTFDGKNHTISGIKIKYDNYSNGCFGIWASIENACISNIEVSGSLDLLVNTEYYDHNYIGVCQEQQIIQNLLIALLM